MAWLRIDDRVRTHPKIVEAGPDAAWFWFCGICYSREHLTDGLIPIGMLASLCPGIKISTAKRLVATLVREHLWHKTKGGYRIHDFLDWNPTREEVLKKRQKDLDRKTQKFRADSMQDSARIPTGKNLDSTRDQYARNPRLRATRAHGSGSGCTDQDLESSLLGKSENPFPVQVVPKNGRGLVTSPLEWDRKHGAVHVTEFCDWVCFPNELADEFARKVTSAPFEEAHGQVLAWARHVRQEWAGRTVPDGSVWDFWKYQWTATHGGSKPNTGKGFDPLAGVKEYLKRG